MMPDFFEIFWSCTLADNGLSIWTTKNASCCGQKLWSLIMVNKCVAAGCSNTSSSSITLFKFPKDPKLRYEWEKQVLCTRCQ